MTEVDYSVYKENLSDIKYMDEESVRQVIKMLEKESDHRRLDKELFDQLCNKDGELYGFLEKVKEINEVVDTFDRLVVCFRGKKLKIYKHNHVLWDQQ